MRKWTNSLFLAAALLLLLLAGGIDQGMDELLRWANFDAWWMMKWVAWIWMAAQLVFAAAIVGLVRLASKWRSARWAAAVTGTGGLLILVYLPLRQSGLVPVLFIKATVWLYDVIEASGFQSYTLVAAAVLAILGGWIAIGGSGKNSEDEKNP